MRRRRNTDHHAQALSPRLAACVVAIVVLGTAVSAALAGSTEQKVSADGTVHRVEGAGQAGVLGTRSDGIRHLEIPLGGEPTIRILPGTDDSAIDSNPAIEIDAATDLPVVVWDREESGDADIVISRFDGNAWSWPEIVVSGSTHDVRPEIRIDGDLVHVMWRRSPAAGRVSIHRTSLDRQTLAPVFGPELLSTTSSSLVPPVGEDAAADTASPSPSKDGSFFAAEVDPEAPGRPPRIFVWGVRDEPMPVGYSQGFGLPDEVTTGTQQASAGWLGGRFVVWFVQGDRLYYTFRDEDRWSDLRSVGLGSDTPPAEALRQIGEMLERLDREDDD